MRVVVLMGGDSPERDVSLVTGDNVAKALVENGHEVIKIDPVATREEQRNLNHQHSHLIGYDYPEEEHLKLHERSYYLRNMLLIMRLRPDLVFNALHGGKGENGIVQGMLDSMGTAYTGSNRMASMIAMDKDLSKTFFRSAKLPTPRSQMLDRPEASRKRVKKLVYPQVVKPNDQGSTIGVRIVRNYEELETAIDEAFQYSQKVIVEEYIAGKELTVGVIKNRMLPVIEIVPKHDFFDYECKYQDGLTDYILPAGIPDEQARELQNLAFKAHNLLGCNGYSRVDFRVSEDGEPYILEVNTLPGFTSHSLVPMAAKFAGINFNSLVEMIVEEAINPNI